MTVIEEIAAERKRQIEVEEWTPAHDDEHDLGELADAASCYIYYAATERRRRTAMRYVERGMCPGRWPWSRDWWKPKSRRKDLIKAGALIVAEIERLDRSAPMPNNKEEKANES